MAIKDQEKLGEVSPASTSASTLHAGSDDVESQVPQQSVPHKVNHFQLVDNVSIVTHEARVQKYPGSGTEDDPFVVNWVHDDPINPQNFPAYKKWGIVVIIAVATLAVAYCASAYSSAIPQIKKYFGSSEGVVTLGTSLYVLGFALGPLMWAPLSELYGRQPLYFITFGGLTIFNVGCAFSNSMATLIVLRFIAGTFGASPLTNSGGVIADMFDASKRGKATAVWASAAFIGPAVGPMAAGFIAETIGWRWNERIMAIFSGIMWIIGFSLIPETYAPVILGRRAAALTRQTGKKHISVFEKKQGKVTPKRAFRAALSRPWALLILEPIVLLITVYMAILYGTLFMLFSAFPIVFEQARGWNQGIGGLSFTGVAVGMMIGVAHMIYDNRRFIRVIAKHGGQAPPEARLPPALFGSIAIPVSIFWFAFTNYPSIPWIVCILATAPFGYGIVTVFLSCMNYLIDSYTIFAASVLAANAVLRAIFGTVFPLFTTQMYANLGIHWASSVPGFLALMCVPFPFLFYKYGDKVRMRCKYAKQAHELLQAQRVQKVDKPLEEEKV